MEGALRHRFGEDACRDSSRDADGGGTAAGGRGEEALRVQAPPPPFFPLDIDRSAGGTDSNGADQGRGWNPTPRRRHRRGRCTTKAHPRQGSRRAAVPCTALRPPHTEQKERKGQRARDGIEPKCRRRNAALDTKRRTLQNQEPSSPQRYHSSAVL
ncbi:hypothetical protein HPB50_012424 [Hyalomma asiaticum]|uniref:Uncharacterized protein n=1 Tax=Hyalomma asiaticum TaxID=266040 RepID=A0ACB7SVX3_HYAAI|nr:hypothetical protein HPB50_012424 [Hyalomma asiaticum]